MAGFTETAARRKEVITKFIEIKSPVLELNQYLLRESSCPEPLDERAEMRLNIVFVQHSRQYKRLTIYQVNIGCFVTFD